MEKVSINPETGCWEWTGSLGGLGYGQMWIGSKADGTWRLRRTHRIAYELLVGTIPEGLQIDHLCRVRCCCNPAHLEPVTARENALRSESFAAVNARKTHCSRGHAYTEDNTYVKPGTGYRECRACIAARRIVE